MPTLALGKLLSSNNNAKPTATQDGPSKKARVRSLSDKRLNDVSQLQRLPTPPALDRFRSDSNYTPSKRRTPRSDGNFNETDDYGFPVVDGLHLQQIADDMQELGKAMLKGRCRTCNRSFQAPAMAIWRCDQCHTANGLSSGVSRGDIERSMRPLSYSKTQDVIDQVVEDGLRRLDEMRPDMSEIPPNGTDSNSLSARPTRRSTLESPKSNRHGTRRRGSAPDTAEIISADSKNKQSMRRESPGPLSFQGARKSHASLQGSILNDHVHVSNPEVPSPPWTEEPASLNTAPEPRQRQPRSEAVRDPFQPIFDHLAYSIKKHSLNISFSTVRGHGQDRSNGDQEPLNKESQELRSSTPPPLLTPITQMGHKELMIGDVYDVASSLVTEQGSPSKRRAAKTDVQGSKLVSQGSPHIDWRNACKWYGAILDPGLHSKEASKGVNGEAKDPRQTTNRRRTQILEDLTNIVRNQVLDLTEQLLVTPQQAPSDIQDIRYLMILLANPLLIDSKVYPTRQSRQTKNLTVPNSRDAPKGRQPSPSRNTMRGHGYGINRPARVLSLILGVLANLPADCHNCIIQWASRYPEDLFRKHVDTLLAFINDRISMQSRKTRRPRKTQKSATYNGVPSSQMFDDMLQTEIIPIQDILSDDWQLRSACCILQLFVRANDIFQLKISAGRLQVSSTSRRRPTGRQLIPTSYFYNSQLDSEDRLNAPQDFDDWERKEQGFQLTQYSFLFTLGTKMRILEYDARKKMASKARQEFFDSILRNTSMEKFFHLKVRRTCMIEDSLQRISEAISSSEGEAKKALKVHFEGEEGIDAGGLRKEWFLLLVRELLDPGVGLFLYNEETNYCYFNPNSLESSEQYQLVGAVLGLAIYNFTILDVPFPPFLFRKLAAAAPPNMGADLHQGWRPNWRPDLSDLAQYDPPLSRNLQQILEYEGDIVKDIGMVFQIDSDAFGKVQHYPLVPGGENRAVTKKNREEYVDLYTEFVLDKSIRKQFEPFARGFFNVCGGNALSLFRGEEIELLIRGSGDLDFMVLRGSVVYENWKKGEDEKELTLSEAVEKEFPVVKWFWELMSLSGPDDQRRVLRWITGSDRIPATGIGSLVLRIQCLGKDCDRLPQARTCFNMLQLWNYKSRGTFIRKFWYAVVESEGFGMK